MYLAKPIIKTLREHAIADWDKNHMLVPSESIVNGVMAVHKNTNEPCAMNPCAEALRLQDLGIDMEEQS